MKRAGLLFGLAVLSCRQSLEVARLSEHSDAEVARASEHSDAPDSAMSGAGADGAARCQVQDCRGKPAACGNCEDDDGDGLVDALDPDCWGGCDDSELTWGQTRECSNQSCYYDRDCGYGNDENCVTLTPKGCDCHGCCTVSGRDTAVYLGSRNAKGEPTCGAATVADPMLCSACDLDMNCLRPCAANERCFGQ